MDRDNNIPLEIHKLKSVVIREGNKIEEQLININKNIILKGNKIDRHLVNVKILLGLIGGFILGIGLRYFDHI